jgi:hypothetical protein
MLAQAAFALDYIQFVFKQRCPNLLYLSLKLVPGLAFLAPGHFVFCVLPQLTIVAAKAAVLSVSAFQVFAGI